MVDVWSLVRFIFRFGFRSQGPFVVAGVYPILYDIWGRGISLCSRDHGDVWSLGSIFRFGFRSQRLFVIF